jgi:hypothetical protein
MPYRNSNSRKRIVRSTLVALAAVCSTALADIPAITPETLMDKAQIENLLVDYYALIDRGEVDYSKFFVVDGVLDVNHVVLRGPEQIKGLYEKMFKMAPIPANGTIHLLITNEKVVVNGNSATADLIWTDFGDKSPTERPFLEEQGREHDELVKQSGQWLLKSRVIRTDAGRLIGS